MVFVPESVSRNESLHRRGRGRLPVVCSGRHTHRHTIILVGVVI